jgi:DNA-binding CsgD family transcriptional regulator
MIAVRDPIPEGIEPLSGYRLWEYEITGRRASLHSLTCSGRQDCPWVNARLGWVTASCRLEDDPWHVTPSEDCSCGFYAVPTVLDVFAQGVPEEHGDGTGCVMGRVELAGRIVEHEFGYRAERARITELVPFEGCTRDVTWLANRLDVPIAPIVSPPPVSPLQLQMLEMIGSGSTTREIAEALKVPPSTVRPSLERAFGALRAGARRRDLRP